MASRRGQQTPIHIRTTAIYTIIVVLCDILSEFRCHVAGRHHERPNIVIIMADDMVNQQFLENCCSLIMEIQWKSISLVNKPSLINYPFDDLLLVVAMYYCYIVIASSPALFHQETHLFLLYSLYCILLFHSNDFRVFYHRYHQHMNVNNFYF